MPQFPPVALAAHSASLRVCLVCRPGHSHTLNCCGKERVQATRVAASPDLEFLLGRPGRWFASWAPQSRVAFRLRPEWLCGRAESKNVANASRKPVESVRAFSLSLPPPQQRYPTPAVLIQIISACPPGLDCSSRNHHCCRPRCCISAAQTRACCPLKPTCLHSTRVVSL